jgi:hypothetical protein
MSEESPLIELRDQLRAAVEAKMQQLPEYRQLKALEEMLAGVKPAANQVVIELPSGNAQTVIGLAKAFIAKAGEPKPTREIVPYVDSVKKFGDPKRAKINVVSALSKAKKHFKSVPWKGEPMWWLADKPLPKERDARAQ